MRAISWCSSRKSENQNDDQALLHTDERTAERREFDAGGSSRANTAIIVATEFSNISKKLSRGERVFLAVER